MACDLIESTGVRVEDQAVSRNPADGGTSLGNLAEKELVHWLSPLPFRRFGATVLLGMGSAAAQTLEVIHAFDGTNGGRNPQAALVVRGNALYGATDSGGEGHSGTFFKLNPDGTGFTILHHFGRLIAQANPDGAYPDSTPRPFWGHHVWHRL